MQLTDVAPGAQLIWLAVPRGGYGYVFRVPVTVIKVGAARVLVQPQHGKARLVKAENLREGNDGK